MSWNGRPVCEDVSFSVPDGRLVCLVGRSGSGKTTIFHAIAGLAMPDSGEVLLDGRDVTGKPGHIGYMLQKDLLLEEHTIADNVCMPLRVRGARKADARREAVGMLAEFGLEGCGGMYPSQLSGGMRQRAALLRTCLMRSEVVLMDEPFSALDAITRMEMRAWLLDMLSRLGMTSMLVTHDVDEAVAMADEVLVLSGAPSQGVPSRIRGAVRVDVPRGQREDFALSDEALRLKKRVLELLE